MCLNSSIIGGTEGRRSILWFFFHAMLSVGFWIAWRRQSPLDRQPKTTQYAVVRPRSVDYVFTMHWIQSRFCHPKSRSRYLPIEVENIDSCLSQVMHGIKWSWPKFELGSAIHQSLQLTNHSANDCLQNIYFKLLIYFCY